MRTTNTLDTDEGFVELEENSTTEVHEPNEKIPLKSLLFWKDKVRQAPTVSFIRNYWINRNYAGFRAAYDLCPICNGSPVYDIENNGEKVILDEINIDRVQCYCITLKTFCDKSLRWEESPWTSAKLGDLKAIDIPSGAAERTMANKNKIVRFLVSPSKWMLINGNPGSGKTHMLHVIKSNLGGFATYISAEAFHQKIMTFTALRNGTLAAFMNKLIHTPVLLFDDWGLQHMTDYTVNLAAQIINERYLFKKLAPIVMTTNLTLVDMELVNGQIIGNQERILSRMKDADISITLTQLQSDWRSRAVRREAGE